MLPHPTTADPALLDRCVAGEASAWRALHDAYAPVVRSFLRRLGAAGPELDDAVQEVFVQLFRSLPRFERRAELKTWLYRICLTQAGRARRRRWVRGGLERLGLVGAPEPRTGLEWSEAEMHDRIGRAVGGLKPIHRGVFVMYELEGLSGEEIAQVVGCPTATVWRRLHDARIAFERLVREGAGGAP